jgi:predicted RNase H-like HicB family nuclease
MRRLHAIAFTKDGEWVAHCLETDIVSSGQTAQEAIDALTEALALQLEHAYELGSFQYVFQPAPLPAWQQLGDLMQQPHRVVVRPIYGGDVEVHVQAEADHDASV